MSAPRWPRLTVVSPGLIGGSIARGARARRLAGEVVVVARHEAAVQTVLDAGAADVGHDRPGGGRRRMRAWSCCARPWERCRA